MIYKKSFGQHFLKNDSTSREIVDLLTNHMSDASIQNTDLLEIGPGAGALTRYLTQYPWRHFKAVEIDRDKIKYLTENNILSDAQIISRDFLDIDRPYDEEFIIIGNFPYNISTQIMFKIFQWAPQVTAAVGMFQKEVAQRICSGHGNKNYGILSVLTQSLYHTSVEIELGPQDFIPPPKVDSAVIRLEYNGNKYSLQNFRKFTSFVKSSFAMRRKTLRNNLKGILNSEVLADPFFNKRPEQISVEEFISLYKTHLNDA